MKKGWLIYSRFEAERNEFFVKQLLNNAKNFDLHLTLLIREDICLVSQNGLYLKYLNQKLTAVDFAVVRVNDFLLSYQLEQMGIKVYNNSRTSLLCNDKYLTYCLATQLGIPTPDTMLVEKQNDNWQKVEENLFPLVAKPLDQKGGKDVFLLKDYGEFLQKSELFAIRFLLQKPTKTLGQDMRIYVLNKKILLSVKRTSKTDFRSNFCLGGNAEIAEPTIEQKIFVDKIAQTLDAHYIGVDFLFDGDKILLNEIEDVVGARMIYALTDVNPAVELLKTVAQNM